MIDPLFDDDDLTVCTVCGQRGPCNCEVPTTIPQFHEQCICTSEGARCKNSRTSLTILETAKQKSSCCGKRNK